MSANAPAYAKAISRRRRTRSSSTSSWPLAIPASTLLIAKLCPSSRCSYPTPGSFACIARNRARSVDEDRAGAEVEDRTRGRDEGERLAEDLVAWPDAEEPQAELDRSGAARERRGRSPKAGL